MSSYGRFPGDSSLHERGFMGMGSATGGGPRRGQRYWGAEAAGRLGVAPPEGATDWNGERELIGPNAAGRIGGGFGGGAGYGMGSPMTSNMPGYSYKTRGSAPRYHEEIPMGGTPGVWAIRNDEIAGPRSDPFQNMSPHDYVEYMKRSIGNRFNRRRGR